MLSNTFKRIWVILNTDINELPREIFGSKEVPVIDIPPNEPKTNNPEPDLRALDIIRERRLILDWRDETMMRIEQEGRDAINLFEKHIKNRTDAVPFYKAFPPLCVRANTVLKPGFDRIVRLAIRSVVTQSWDSLKNTCNSNKYQTIADKCKFPIDIFPQSHLPSLSKLWFTPANHAKIRNAMPELITGKDGIVAMFQKQIVNISNLIIREIGQ